MSRELFPAIVCATSALLGVAACSDEQPKPTTSRSGQTVEITNILEVPIFMSSVPDSLSPMTRRGELGVGEKAVAVCVSLVEGYPESTAVYVKDGTEEGWVSLTTGSTKTEKGRQQISPGYEDLVAQVPNCTEL